MKDEIIALLRSENFEDKILGVKMMEAQGLTEEILPKTDDLDNWCSRIKWFYSDDVDDDRYANIVVNKKLFNVWREGLGLIKKRYYHEVQYDELIYTDGSIDIQQVISEYNELRKKYNE